MTAIDEKRVTLAEFLALPEGPPYYEFENGELVKMPSPTADHQDIVGELFSALRRVCRQQQLGRVFMEVDVHLPDGRVFVPDLSYLSTENENLLSVLDDKIHGAPDLVVEVLSQDEQRDRVHKFGVYYRNGVLWYWIINPATLTIEEYEAGPNGYALRSTTLRGQAFAPGVFPGFTLDLAALLG